jgi:hypothetical protein
MDETAKTTQIRLARSSPDCWRVIFDNPPLNLMGGWDACMASIARPAAQHRVKALFELGFHKPGDAEDRLGSYLGRIGR